jgi:hypothetical protein
MENSESKKGRRAEKPALNVTGQLAIPERLLPWERDLLTLLLEAVDGSAERKMTDIEVAS